MKEMAIVLAMTVLAANMLFGHCDTMNGPVVVAAQEALETGNVDLVLIWVQKNDEAVIKDAFTKTLAVRKLGPEAKMFADMYFFETLVRIHRAGEGVAYTGLKSAETEIEPGIEAADRALDRGSAEELLKRLDETIHRGIHDQFTNATTKKNFRMEDVAAGREYVKSYVEFIHYAERLFQAASKPVGGHSPKSEEPRMQEHNH